MGEFAFQTLRESITSAIRSKILTGELQPGVKLAEQKLAEEFGSSRAPIREALRQLEHPRQILQQSYLSHHRPHMPHCFYHIAGTSLSLRADHCRSLTDTAQCFAQIAGTADKRDLKSMLVEMI